MTELFISILNMSIISSYVALAVIFIRLLLKKHPKIFSYSLWSIVLFRLINPFSFSSFYSLIPSIFINQQNAMSSQNVTTNIQPEKSIALVNNIKNSFSHIKLESKVNITNALDIIAFVWVIGMIGLLIYSIISYLNFRKLISTATRVDNNIYETDMIVTPCVFGFIKPKIYIMPGINIIDNNYILLHEKTHIKRLDYLIKPFAYIVLILHWFNPLMWICFFLMVKDMEMSCDENVIRKTAIEHRSSYSNLLLSFAVCKKAILSPLAFGESNVCDRINNIINYKKNSFWINILIIALITLTMSGLGCNKKILAVTNEINIQNVIEKYYDLSYDSYLDLKSPDMSSILDLNQIQNQNKVISLDETIEKWKYSLQKGYCEVIRERYPITYNFTKIEIVDNKAIVHLAISGNKNEAYPPFITFGENIFVLQHEDSKWLISEQQNSDIEIIEQNNRLLPRKTADTIHDEVDYEYLGVNVN